MMRNLIGLFCMVAAVPLAFAVEMWGPEFDENQTNTHSHVRRRSLSHVSKTKQSNLARVSRQTTILTFKTDLNLCFFSFRMMNT